MRRRASRRSVSSCDSPGPRVPTPAAEPLEVLPHAAHARQVVLELRELDLELALGADGVLGEDVEDQLRAVDDPRVERVLERALLDGLELVVDEQDVGAGVLEAVFSSASLPLPTYVRGSGRAACCTSSPTGSTPRSAPARGARRARPRRRLLSASTASTKPRSGSRPGADRAGGSSSRRMMPGYAPPMESLAERLAARTLELIDIPSREPRTKPPCGSTCSR